MINAAVLSDMLNLIDSAVDQWPEATGEQRNRLHQGIARARQGLTPPPPPRPGSRKKPRLNAEQRRAAAR